MEKRCRFAQLLLRDVDRDINGRLFERFDEDPRLGARAGAESDQLDVRSEMRGDFGSMSIQNIDLGPRDVILRQLANFLEQRRAALIVEILARQRTWIAGKTGDTSDSKSEAAGGTAEAGCTVVSWSAVIMPLSFGASLTVAPYRFTVDRVRA